MQTVRHAHTKTSARALLLAALLAALALPFSAQPARAATITISDQASCEATDGFWDSSRNSCFFPLPYTVAAGDVLQTTVGVEFESLTNNGAINFTAGATVGDAFVNHGSINITNGDLRLRATSENKGTINVMVGVLEVFPSDSVLANQGTVNVHSDGDIWNDEGTINNPGTITLACGGLLSGSPIQGNPVQAPADCPAHQAKQS